ncbi:unnamed protein product [Caenorhabditis auriculariae]|uniref:Uncharacterized protein n=1 Tax=Caenorhabditis auriculariae TaxID=2777116 RepID=A0A8S1GP80_9PELO|nr:unnamed protein product [Caenorhabditis auriculariae]
MPNEEMGDETIEEIYAASQAIDNALNAEDEKYLLFERAASSQSEKVKLLGIRMLFRYFHHFNRQTESQRILYFALTDRNSNIRKAVIKDLPTLCKNGTFVNQVVDILSQLLIAKDPQELNLVRNALVHLNNDFPKECLCALYNAVNEASKTHERLQILWFFEEKRNKSMTFNQHIIEDLSKKYIKMLDDVEREDVALLFHLLSTTHFLNSIECSKKIADIVVGDPCRFPCAQVILLLKNRMVRMPKNMRHDKEFAGYRNKIAEKIIGVVPTDEMLDMLHYLEDAKVVSGFEIDRVGANLLAETSFEQLSEDMANNFDLFVEKLYRVHYLAQVGFGHQKYLNTMTEWMLSKLSAIELEGVEERQNFYMFLATFSIGTEKKSHDAPYVVTFFNRLWELLPSQAEAAQAAILNESVELESVCVAINNLVDLTPELYELVATTCKEWRLRVSNAIALCRQITANPPPSIKELEEQEHKCQIYRINSIGFFFWKFLGNRCYYFLPPSWLAAPKYACDGLSSKTPTINCNGDLDAVKEKINSSNVHDFVNGRAPIHVAADFGQAEVIKYLISLGADFNAPDKFGITPLLAAVWEGHLEATKVLLSNGAVREVKAPDGTPLIECTENQEIRNLLVS